MAQLVCMPISASLHYGVTQVFDMENFGLTTMGLYGGLLVFNIALLIWFLSFYERKREAVLKRRKQHLERVAPHVTTTGGRP